MIQYIIERDLINGQIIGSDIEEIWMSGVKNYFGNDVDVQPWHILQNRNWGFGKLCRPGLDTISILGGAMMFDQYSKRVLNAEYDKNIIKKFLNNIDISNIDYSTSAMIDETMNNVDIFVKHLKEKFI
jgi:Zn-dependent M32 family carboxypeptidase